MMTMIFGAATRPVVRWVGAMIFVASMALRPVLALSKRAAGLLRDC